MITWKTTMRRVGNKGTQTTIPSKILEMLGEGLVVWTYDGNEIKITTEKVIKNEDNNIK